MRFAADGGRRKRAKACYFAHPTALNQTENWELNSGRILDFSFALTRVKRQASRRVRRRFERWVGTHDRVARECG